MKVAITTKYLGPTTHRGSRVKAIARKRTDTMPELSLTISWEYGESSEQNHARVARMLAESLNWTGVYVGGSVDGSGFVFVNVGRLAPLFGADSERDRDWFYIKESKS